MDHKEQIAQLMVEFADVFAEDGKLGWTSIIMHSIHTGEAQPICQPVQRIPLCQRQEMQDLLTEMQAKDVIQPSQSHMKWAIMYGFYFHKCPRESQRNCTGHGQAPLLS